jgi:hypothetical protein
LMYRDSLNIPIICFKCRRNFVSLCRTAVYNTVRILMRIDNQAEETHVLPVKSGRPVMRNFASRFLCLESSLHSFLFLKLISRQHFLT